MTAGSCAAVANLCSSDGSYFLRESTGYEGNSNHLGKCEQSTVCSKFDYTNDRGFSTLESA